MTEWLTLSFLYGMLKDIKGWIGKRSLTPAEKLALREKWKPLFFEEIQRCRKGKLRQDVIIHDVRRMDLYPETADGKGISGWFRTALVGQYHRGVELALGIHSITFEDLEQQWRLSDYDGDEEKFENAYLIGYVPYENIVSVNWDGDEYYGYPHIFCKFAHRGQPYERLAFCRQGSLYEGHEFFTELASYQDVKLTSQKFGTSKFLWRS
jgi:hypothetical protein